MNPTKQVLLDSGLFTQVEPEWLAESDGCATLVNKSRGVVAKIKYKGRLYPALDTASTCARMFFDLGDDTYHSSGWYDVEEIENWILPVMRSDAAWKKYTELPEHERDLTLCI